MDSLKQFLGIAPDIDFKELIKQNATIVDVRTKEEYRQGHIKQSVNIPLNNLNSEHGSISKDRPVITCCASGMRSAQAKIILQNKGFTRVFNGGGWLTLYKKLEQS